MFLFFSSRWSLIARCLLFVVYRCLALVVRRLLSGVCVFVVS